MTSQLRAIAAWYWLAARYAARDLWDSLPGPWPAKVAVIVVTQVLLPGPADDLLLAAVIALWRRRRAIAALLRAAAGRVRNVSAA